MILLYTGSDKKDRKDIERIVKQNRLDNSVRINDYCVPDGQNTIGITGDSHDRSLRYLKSLGVDAIVCGMSSPCTVTLSSSTHEQAVVCIQRSLRTLAGKQVEPGEFPIRLTSSLSPYAVMAISTVFILCDKLPENIG